MCAYVYTYVALSICAYMCMYLHIYIYIYIYRVLTIVTLYYSIVDCNKSAFVIYYFTYYFK